MCIRIVFGHTDEQLTKAQWDVVNALRRAVDGGITNLDARRILRDIFARAYAPTPEQWAAEVAQALVETIAHLQAAAALDDAREVQRLRRQCDYLQRLVDDYTASPLHQQVQVLSQERDRWRAEADRLDNQIHALEDTLRRAQQAHQAEVAHLRAEIAALNRIIVEQQEELNERND